MDAIFIKCDKIWTGTGAQADAILYSEAGILAVGSEREVRSHPKYQHSRKHTLNGCTMMPGLTDFHQHLLSYAKQKYFIDLSYVNGEHELYDILLKRARNAEEGEWICAFNLNESGWKFPVLPDRRVLDGLGIPNPVLIQRYCTHVSILNSRALEICGLGEATSTEGVILDGDGRPNGLLLEEIQSVPYARVDRDCFDQRKLLDLLRWSVSECASYGLTSIVTCGSAGHGMDERMELYHALRATDSLKTRIFIFLDGAVLPEVRTHSGDQWVSYQGTKIFVDGTLGARTAALSSPYADSPAECGILHHDTENLAEMFRVQTAEGRQVLLHALGDAAIDRVLDAWELMLSRFPEYREHATALPPVINHCMVCRPDQIERIARLQLVAAVQPTFVQSDRDMAPKRLGERIEKGWVYRWKDLIDAGILINGSSDSPSESIDPWDGIWSAVGRKIGREVWMPEQRLSVEEAIRIYTVNPAVTTGTASWRGTLEAGKAADMALIDRDIFTCHRYDHEDTEVLCTIAGGRITHGRLDY